MRDVLVIQRQLDDARADYRHSPSEHNVQRCERLYAELEAAKVESDQRFGRFHASIPLGY
jgi:hypothetical protein